LRLLQSTAIGVSLQNLDLTLATSHATVVVAVRKFSVLSESLLQHVEDLQSKLVIFADSVKGKPFTTSAATFIKAALNKNEPSNEESYFCR